MHNRYLCPSSNGQNNPFRDKRDFAIPGKTWNYQLALSCFVPGTNGIILFSKKQLDIVIREYMDFYHKHWPHQEIDNDLIEPDPVYDCKDAEIVEGAFLGGHLNYYYRQAA